MFIGVVVLSEHVLKNNVVNKRNIVENLIIRYLKITAASTEDNSVNLKILSFGCEGDIYEFLFLPQHIEKRDYCFVMMMPL